MYAQVVEDVNGIGKLGAVIITKGENALSISTMLA